MTESPDWEEVQRQREFAEIGFEETLGLEKTDQLTYTGEWLPVSTFALLHQQSYACLNEGVESSTERVRYAFRESLPTIEYPTLTQIQFQERQSIETTDKYDSLADHAAQTDPESRPTVITYGIDETFWQALGAFELAQQDYIMFPEALSNRWGYGRPDLTAFQLGRLQEVLADIGIVPGGASLQEIELRTTYEIYTPTSVTATTTVGVAEAKGNHNARRGRRELTDNRNNGKPPYLDGQAIEKGWLLAPNATAEINTNDTEIGGVTWMDDQSIYVEPPDYVVSEDKRSEAVQIAKRLVLDIVLRRQELSDSLDSTIENCLSDPEHLYSIFDRK